MWTSTNFQTYKKQFDFTSSNQGKRTYTSLKIGDMEFINMVEALDGEIEENQVFQTIICDHCGTYHCSSGNWIAVRQFNGFIFFIPAFEKIKDERDVGEYNPPYLFQQNGAYWLSIEDFDNFKKYIPELEKQSSIKQLTKFELISLYKWDSPLKIFDDFSRFQTFRKNQVLAVSAFDNEIIFEILESKIKEIEESIEFEIKPLTETDEIISIFLDNNPITEWKALCKTEDNYQLLLGGIFTVICKQKETL